MEQPTSAPVAAPIATGHTKQYVFVDEYNRHKRLKVMRACDGCRKRKIRCDGALQNGPWPCGACVRLKLKCIPPTLDQDDDQQTPDSAPGQHAFSFQNTTFSDTSPVNSKTSASTFAQRHPGNPQLVHDWASSVTPPIATTAAPVPGALVPNHYDAGPYNHHPFQVQPVDSRSTPTYSPEYYGSSHAPSQFQQVGHVPGLLRADTVTSEGSSGDPQEIDASVRELSEQMGDLQIDVTSEALWVKNHQNSAEAPATDEAAIILPASVFTDSAIRVPPEMMPSEERALDYFGYFFDHIHPYVPVLNRSEFFIQWQNNRNSVSPLLLEGIFACVARYLDEPIEARRWLALAARHEENFKDVPRVSTIQALIVLMKAKEGISKPGYYYRSWMTVKYMATVGLDLGLHEHIDRHGMEDSCTLTKSDCMVRTRIWQLLFIFEILVGAPLGRSDFSVDIDTVQFTLPFPAGDVDAFEHQMSRRCTFLAQGVRNIKISNQLWHTLKKYKKDWALDSAFVRHNEDMPHWLQNLPADFQIHYPEEGTPPWLGGDHFVAYVHCYYHLVVIMHHRPQLQALLDKGDPEWRKTLDICLASATFMCRIQEALYRDFGFHGLQFMIRGINFTIYCVLTCTMLHLAAITCPDPALNTQARMYFTRHMRVLEHCLPSSPPEMRVQINALREAFSVDTSQVFVLKPTLGLRSPPMENHSTPSSTHSVPTSAPTLTNAPSWSNLDSASSKTMTPVTEYGTPFDNVSVQGMPGRPPLPHHSSSYDTQVTYPPPSLQVSTAPMGYALEPVISNEQTPVWDPSGIFNNWSTAFGGAAPPPQPSPPDTRRMQPTSAPIMPNQTSSMSAQALYSSQQLPMPAAQATTPPAIPTVTPVMWQDAFTSAFVSGHGQKRYREASVDQSGLSQFASINSNKRRG